jgi:hypothetical protein
MKKLFYSLIVLLVLFLLRFHQIWADLVFGLSSVRSFSLGLSLVGLPLSARSGVSACSTSFYVQCSRVLKRQQKTDRAVVFFRGWIRSFLLSSAAESTISVTRYAV